MRYALQIIDVILFMHESLKRDNKTEGDEKINVKQRERIKTYFLRCCCVFQVTIIKKQQPIIYVYRL